VAQVLVKNGHLYEGIFRTFSPKVCTVKDLMCVGISIKFTVEHLVKQVVFYVSCVMVLLRRCILLVGLYKVTVVI